jgi:hypothetical protein
VGQTAGLADKSPLPIMPADQPVARPDAPQVDLDALRGRLAAELAHRGLTATAFARRAKVSQPVMSRFVKGATISTRTAAKIETALEALR